MNQMKSTILPGAEVFDVIYLKTQLAFYTIYSENSNSVNNLAREMKEVYLHIPV